MNADKTPSASTVDPQAQILSFIERLYWVLGLFCLYWFTRLEIVDYRMLPLEFPIFGSCFASEALIFSLSFFWAPLLALHLFIHAYQSRFAARQQWAGFPGVLGDLPIPRTLAWVRLIVFIALVMLPTGAYIWSSGRALLRLNLHWSDEPQPRMSAWQSIAQWRPPAGQPANWYFLSGGWSWQHKDGEWREVTFRQPSREKATRTKPVSTSAYPGIQPSFFIVMDVLLLTSLAKLVSRGR